MGDVVTGSAALSARLLRFRMWDDDGAEGRPHKRIQWKDEGHVKIVNVDFAPVNPFKKHKYMCSILLHTRLYFSGLNGFKRILMMQFLLMNHC